MDRSAQLEDTADLSVVLADDLGFLRELCGKPRPTQGDIRRSTTILRRVLLEGDLARAAGPRVGKIRIAAPNSHGVTAINAARPISLLTRSLPKMFGIKLHAMVAGVTNESDIAEIERDCDAPLHDLSVAQFLNDPVIFFQGEIITRKDIIDYSAYVAYGIHSRGKRPASADVLDKVRYLVVLSPSSAVGIDADVEFSTPGSIIPRSRRRELDKGVSLPFLHLFATIRILVESPLVIELERVIELEGAA